MYLSIYLYICSKCRTRKTASRPLSIQVQLVSYQSQANGHDLVSYQCQQGHKLSYQCHHGHELLNDQYQTNVSTRTTITLSP